MGRPPKDPLRDTRQAILDAALELFAERGFFGVGLRDIARRAGLREAALYHYFDGKDALFGALLDAQAVHLREVHAHAEAPVDDLRDFLLRIGRALLEEMAAPREQLVFRMMLQDGFRLVSEGRLNPAERIGARVAFGERLMARLVAEGHLRPAPAGVLDVEFFAPFAVWRHLRLALPDHPLVTEPDAFLRGHVDHFLRAAAVAPPPPPPDDSP